jgi:hypothetical protein
VQLLSRTAQAQPLRIDRIKFQCCGTRGYHDNEQIMNKKIMNNGSEFIPRLDTQPLPPARQWDEFASIPPESVLYGGTATARHLGHRESVNFEFLGDIGKALTIPACCPPLLWEGDGAGLACQPKIVLPLKRGDGLGDD